MRPLPTQRPQGTPPPTAPSPPLPLATGSLPALGGLWSLGLWPAPRTTLLRLAGGPVGANPGASGELAGSLGRRRGQDGDVEPPGPSRSRSYRELRALGGGPARSSDSGELGVFGAGGPACHWGSGLQLWPALALCRRNFLQRRPLARSPATSPRGRAGAPGADPGLGTPAPPFLAGCPQATFFTALCLSFPSWGCCKSMTRGKPEHWLLFAFGRRHPPPRRGG